MKISTQQREAARCAYLHGLCLQIEKSRAAGATVKQAIGRAGRYRAREIFKHGKLSRSRLTSLYFQWRPLRTPSVFRRNYKAGFLPRIPLALIEEFLNRLTADRVVPASQVMQSLRSDWKAGKAIPGLGTWQAYWSRTHGEAAARAVPPAFPASTASFYSYLSSSTPSAYQQRIRSALRAQRELNRFLDFIETRRNEVSARRRHEPLGQTFPQPKPTIIKKT